MAKIKNKSGDDRIVPGLGGRLVLAGALVELDAADVASYTCQTSIWEPADDEACAAHDAAFAEPAEPAITDNEGQAA